jgi:hypothetical protein
VGTAGTRCFNAQQGILPVAAELTVSLPQASARVKNCTASSQDSGIADCSHDLTGLPLSGIALERAAAFERGQADHVVNDHAILISLGRF